MLPTYSFGVYIFAVTNGSSIYEISCGFGNSVGLYISKTSPVVLCTLYITDGAVVINPKSNSLSSLSSIISKCNKPKNPHLNPNPNAAEFSGSYTNAASFNCNFSNATFKFSYSLPSTGYIPQYTIGVTFLYPSNGSSAGLSFNVTVSPTCISDKFFTLAAIYPTSPAFISLVGIYDPGTKYPTSVTVYVFLAAINNISSPTFTVPSFTLTYATAPL